MGRRSGLVVTSGFVGSGTPDALLQGIADRYAATGAPAGLSLGFAAGQGDGEQRGLDRLAVPPYRSGVTAWPGAPPRRR